MILERFHLTCTRYENGKKVNKSVIKFSTIESIVPYLNAKMAKGWIRTKTESPSEIWLAKDRVRVFCSLTEICKKQAKLEGVK